MVADFKEGRKCSDKMEGSEGLRTLECLRGRLQAERQTSKLAKEEAEAMGNKLIELENQLREETKLKEKAEKKLQLLKKKLHSLKISSRSVDSSSSSSKSCEISSGSCSSSSNTSYPEEQDSKFMNLNSLISQSISENVSDSISSKKGFEETQDHGNSNPSQDSEFSQVFDNGSSSLNSSMEEDDIDLDDSLALVPVSLPRTAETKDVRPLDERVSEVLDSLKHIREKIQNSLNTRNNMIKVG